MTQDFINFAVTRKARFSADKAAHATSRLSGWMKGQFAARSRLGLRKSCAFPWCHEATCPVAPQSNL
jgi:hypothetical protein